MTGGFGLNVTNQMAAQFYADHGLNSVLILPEVKDVQQRAGTGDHQRHVAIDQHTGGHSSTPTMA